MLSCFAAALAATPAVGDPSIASKQAEAQSVMSQVQQLDSSLERAVEAYDLATVKLNRVRADLKANHVQLQIAKESLRRAQASLSARLVSLYTSDGQGDSLSVLLGASSLDDLVNRFNTANRISAQDSHVLGQVTRFDNEVKAQEVRLKHAKAEADALVRQPASPAPPSTDSSVVSIAMRYLGTPYVWGGASPSGFDCSGLVMYVFSQVGVSLPHSSYSQYGMGSPVSRDQLQPGDLVFFDGLGHVGIYVGGGSFIHAPHTGDVVKISSISGWYASTYVGARRI